MRALRNDARFSNVRRLGTITALDLKSRMSGYLATIALDLMRFFTCARTVCCARSGNTIYVLPPYCVEAAGTRSRL